MSKFVTCQDRYTRSIFRYELNGDRRIQNRTKKKKKRKRKEKALVREIAKPNTKSFRDLGKG